MCVHDALLDKERAEFDDRSEIVGENLPVLGRDSYRFWAICCHSRRVKSLTRSIIELGELLITLEDFLDVRLHDVDDLVDLRLRRLQPFLRGDLLRRPGTTDDAIGACTRSRIRC